MTDIVDSRHSYPCLRSAYESHKDETPKLWSSEGVGTFDIGDLDDSIRQDRGTSVVIYLKDENIEYCDEKVVKRILKKYSNFVNFPIYLNGNRVNTMEAVWAKHPKDVDEKTYTAFYKFIAKAFDEPLDRLHFRADAPLEVKALFYIPSFHSEKYGMTRMEPGVSLYSRKVLIESQSPDILPDWMRFVKGVVDSEDLPLSLSREKPQDSALIAKLRKALTRKFISHLSKMAKYVMNTVLLLFCGLVPLFALHSHLHGTLHTCLLLSLVGNDRMCTRMSFTMSTTSFSRKEFVKTLNFSNRFPSYCTLKPTRE